MASSANKTFTFGRRELDKGINAKIFHLAFQFMGGERGGEDSVLPPVKLRKVGPNLLFLLPITGEYLFSMELPPLPVIVKAGEAAQKATSPTHLQKLKTCF